MTEDQILELQAENENLRRELSALSFKINHSETQIRAVINALPVGMIVVNSALRIEASNPYCLALFRGNYQNLIEKNVADLFTDKDLHTLFSSDLSFDICQRREVVALRFDKERFDAAIAIKAFLGVRGMKFIVIIEDISQRKRDQKLRDEFFAMMSHDFRSPLTSINLSSDLLHEMLEQTVSAQTDSFVKMSRSIGVITESSSRLLLLVNKLLELQKLQSSAFTFYFEKIWLNAILEQCFKEVEQLASARKIWLKADNNVRCMLVADRERLIQVFINLLSNAIKYSPSNSIIDVSASNNYNEISIFISDRGPGVPDDYKRSIFEKFKQGPKRTLDPLGHSGTGLGLPICKSIIEGHGGLIGVSDRDGGGSTFWISLPTRVDN